MYSFSSASQMCDPFPRTINGGSPPTAPNALTGEFTPPGIMLSARFCRRRDCSTFREMVDGMSTPAKESANNDYATDHYNSDRAAQLIRYSLFRHHSATSPRYRRFINPLLTGRVQGTASGAPGCPYFIFKRRPLTRITSNKHEPVRSNLRPILPVTPFHDPGSSCVTGCGLPEFPPSARTR